MSHEPSPRLVAKRPTNASANDDPVQTRVLSLTVDLGNTVLTKRAAGDLLNIKSKAGEHFTSVRLFRRVMAILESHAFRLPVRRFILELFDKSVMRHVVLDDEDDD